MLLCLYYGCWISALANCVGLKCLLLNTEVVCFRVSVNLRAAMFLMLPRDDDCHVRRGMWHDVDGTHESFSVVRMLRFG